MAPIPFSEERRFRGISRDRFGVRWDYLFPAQKANGGHAYVALGVESPRSARDADSSKNCQPPHHFTKVTSADSGALIRPQTQTKLAQLDAGLGIL